MFFYVCSDVRPLVSGESWTVTLNEFDSMECTTFEDKDCMCEPSIVSTRKFVSDVSKWKWETLAYFLSYVAKGSLDPNFSRIPLYYGLHKSEYLRNNTLSSTFWESAYLSIKAPRNLKVKKAFLEIAPHVKSAIVDHPILSFAITLSVTSIALIPFFSLLGLYLISALNESIDSMVLKHVIGEAEDTDSGIEDDVHSTVEYCDISDKLKLASSVIDTN